MILIDRVFAWSRVASNAHMEQVHWIHNKFEITMLEHLFGKFIIDTEGIVNDYALNN